MLWMDIWWWSGASGGWVGDRGMGPGIRRDRWDGMGAYLILLALFVTFRICMRTYVFHFRKRLANQFSFSREMNKLLEL